MTTVKAADVPRRFPDAARLPAVMLVFGPDRGLVTEVTDYVLGLFSAQAADPFSVVRLDAAAVAADPARLGDEANTVSLFGDRRLVLVRDGGAKNLSPAVQPLLAAPPRDAVVLIEAGDLKKGPGLRKLVEDDRTAVAIHCPADGARDLERMIDEEAARFGLKVEPDARAALADRLGADRAASRAEVTKACLHALDSGALTLADVNAVVGDVAAHDMVEAVNAALVGQRQVLDRLLTRLLRQEAAGVQLLMQAQWSMHGLETAAASVAAGAHPARAAEAIRPPVYGPARDTAIRVLERWPYAKLRAASALVARATFQTRIMPALAGAIARDTLLRIASQAAGGRQ